MGHLGGVISIVHLSFNFIFKDNSEKHLPVKINACNGCHFLSIEPVHEISNNMAFATSKASDQPAHMCSLIRAFASGLSIL